MIYAVLRSPTSSQCRPVGVLGNRLIHELHSIAWCVAVYRRQLNVGLASGHCLPTAGELCHHPLRDLQFLNDSHVCVVDLTSAST